MTEDSAPGRPGAPSGPIPLPTLASRSGLDVLRAMMAGQLPPPPIALTLNFWLAEVEEGRVVFEGEARESFYNPLGSVHGGWTATILDSAMACAVHSALRPGQGYATAEFKLNCVRPIFADGGRVRCEGRILSMGRAIATSEGRLLDAKGRLLAHGTETCALFSRDANQGEGKAGAQAGGAR